MNGKEHIEPACSRRQFLGSSAKTTAGVAAGMVGLSGASGREAPRAPLGIGIVGLRGQGRKLARQLIESGQVRIQVVCDVDASVLSRVAREIEELQGFRPLMTGDHQQLVDESSIEAVVVATPDHWHERVTRDALTAGRDIYLETPGGHSLLQSLKIAQLADRTDRLVHLGMPHRSREHFATAADVLRSGRIGRIGQVRAWSASRRKPQSSGASREIPEGVDYDRWLGPAATRPFDSTAFHHQWKWHWDFGCGELGLWGVQMLDIARHSLQLDLPERVSSIGISHTGDSNVDPPDTMQVLYQYSDCVVSWEHRHWTQYGNEGRSTGVAFYGDEGSLIVDHGGWKIYNSKLQLGQDARSDSLADCLQFVQAVRSRVPSSADIRLTLPSLLLCHLGNLAYRANQMLDCRNNMAEILGDARLASLCGSHQRAPWA